MVKFNGTNGNNTMANRMFRQFFNSLHKYPVILDCNFIVDSANGNGLGIRSLKPTGSAKGIASVYMHTSSTPATGNPNPASGYIVVNFTDSWYGYISGFSGQVAPLSGSSATTTTAGSPVVIVSLGTATLAQWQAAGLPVGQTPTVGQAFIALATSVAGGGAVEASLVSGIDHIEVIGDPNQTLRSSVPGQGGYMILQCLAAGVVTAPANGSVIGLDFQLSNSNLY